MSENKQISENKQTNVTENQGAGKVTFANDVIAVIAALAASDTKGIAGMVGGAMSGFSELLGRKNLTKGVKVEVGTEEVAADVYVVVQYGFKIQDVAAQIQSAVKNAIETMTGLRVVEVNVYVEGISLDAAKDKEVKIIDTSATEEVQPTSTARVK